MFVASNLSSLIDLLDLIMTSLHKHTFITTLIIMILMIIFHLFIKKKASKKVFLIDFVCYKPPITLESSRKHTVDLAKHSFKLPEETIVFMKSTMDKAGLGDSTYLPLAFLTDPPSICMEEARRETEMVMFGAIDELLEKTGVKCVNIGILVVNCCLFNVVPSLCSMIVNRYKLRDNVVTYNLSGMGCSAGLRAIGLVQHLLQVHSNCYALMVSTENITENFYKGSDRSKILINCLFRIGGAAILFSNRPSDRLSSSKYQLIHTVHTHTASSDLSYKSIIQEEDKDGHLGVSITKDLLTAAIRAIKPNITTLGPLVLPVYEQFRYLVINKYLIHVAKIKPYVPNFKTTFDHFFAHVGGKPVLDELQRNLGLSEDDMEASRMTLYRFGNTSSSSIWYELAYAEAKGRIKRGDRLWQIAFGSGFKCSSAIWRSTRTVHRDEINLWSTEINGFPVDIGDIGPLPYYFEPSDKNKSLD